MPPGGARRYVRPLLASQVVGKSLRLWFTSLPQLVVVAAMICIPFFVLRWMLRGEEGWKTTLAGSLPSIQMLAVAAIGQSFAMRFVFQRLRGERTDLARSIAAGARRIGTVAGISLLLALPWIAYVATILLLARDLESSHGQRAVTLAGPGMVLAGAAFLVFELIVLLVFPVATPAAVVEGGGIFASLRRSARLTKGRRSTI